MYIHTDINVYTHWYQWVYTLISMSIHTDINEYTHWYQWVYTLISMSIHTDITEYTHWYQWVYTLISVTLISMHIHIDINAYIVNIPGLVQYHIYAMAFPLIWGVKVIHVLYCLKIHVLYCLKIHVLYCLELRSVSYKCLVSFSGQGKQQYNKNIHRVWN